MSVSTTPVAGPVALPAKAASPAVLAPGVPSLAAFLDLMIGKLVPTAKPAIGKGERQGDAATGKDLPEADKQPPIDPALAWLFVAPALPAPQPIAIALPQTAADLAKSVGLDLPVPGLGAGLPETADALAPHQPTPNPSLQTKAISDTAPTPVQLQPIALQPVPLAVTPPPTAAALPALFALAMTSDREARDSDAPAAPTAITTLQPAPTASVAPTGDTQRQSLDLGARDWPQKMIDHIEALRDNANANDTSIRLKPEALGQVDVSLRTHTDGAISVRFTADQPTTRTLLADAAPQLTAAAEARGIRLSGTSVDLGGQGDQHPPAQADRPQNISNHLAAPRGDDSEAVDDGRIA